MVKQQQTHQHCKKKKKAHGCENIPVCVHRKKSILSFHIFSA